MHPRYKFLKNQLVINHLPTIYQAAFLEDHAAVFDC